MLEYLKLVKNVIKNGILENNRTNIKSLAIFGAQIKINLQNGFPLLTTKKLFFKGIVHELLWFIKGDTNIQYLCKNNINFWNPWPYDKYKKSASYQGESIIEFKNKIINDNNFAKKWGNLGPVYGKQWRNFNGVDQLKNIINEIKTNPNSRRIILNAWNVNEINKMILPPCHLLVQFNVSQNKYLSCHLYQRSADLFLGVPFNIASYSLLLTIIAKECNLIPKYFIHSFGNLHIYQNHIKQIKQQIKRKPLTLPKIKLLYDAKDKSIFDIKYSDIKLENYFFHAKLEGDVAV